jgi:hypothetical protein
MTSINITTQCYPDSEANRSEPNTQIHTRKIAKKVDINELENEM